MTTCQGKLYVVGGNDKGPGAGYYDPIFQSENNQLCWSLFPKAFVIGGEARTKMRLSFVLKYNPDTDLWHRVSSLSILRSSVCTVADCRYLHVIGGNSSIGYLDVAEKCDPDADSWSKIPSTI